MCDLLASPRGRGLIVQTAAGARCSEILPLSSATPNQSRSAVSIVAPLTNPRSRGRGQRLPGRTRGHAPDPGPRSHPHGHGRTLVPGACPGDHPAILFALPRGRLAVARDATTSRHRTPRRQPGPPAPPGPGRRGGHDDRCEPAESPTASARGITPGSCRARLGPSALQRPMRPAVFSLGMGSYLPPMLRAPSRRPSDGQRPPP